MGTLRGVNSHCLGSGVDMSPKKASFSHYWSTIFPGGAHCFSIPLLPEQSFPGGLRADPRCLTRAGFRDVPLGWGGEGALGNIESVTGGLRVHLIHCWATMCSTGSSGSTAQCCHTASGPQPGRAKAAPRWHLGAQFGLKAVPQTRSPPSLGKCFLELLVQSPRRGKKGSLLQNWFA